MTTRKIFLTTSCALVLASAAGCAALKKSFTPLPGQTDSPALQEARAAADSGLLGPWGQLILMGVTGLQTAVMSGNVVKNQSRKARAQHATEVARQVAAAVAAVPPPKV